MVKVVDRGNNRVNEEGQRGVAQRRRNVAATAAQQVGLLTVLSNIRVCPPRTTSQTSIRPPRTTTSQGNTSNVAVTPAVIAPRMSTSGASRSTTGSVPLQRAYGGRHQAGPSSSIGRGEVPVLHLSGSSLGSTSSEFRALLDVIENDTTRPGQSAAAASISDGVRATRAPEIEAIASDLRRSVEVHDSIPNRAEYQHPALLSPLSDDSDSDFEPAPKRTKPVSRSSSSRKGMAQPSSSGAGKSSVGTEPARQKKSTAVRATPKMDAGTSVLRNLLERPSTSSTTNPKVAAPTTESRKGKSVAGGQQPVKSGLGSKNASFRAQNAALEAGCSKAALPAPRPQKTPALNYVADSSSDSESEFMVFSQLPQRHIFQRCFKEFDVIEREHRENVATFEEARASVERSEQQVQRLEDERRRIQEEIRRLQNEERRVTDQLGDAEQAVRSYRDLEQRRRDNLEKSTKKIGTIRNRLKRLGE